MVSNRKLQKGGYYENIISKKTRNICKSKFRDCENNRVEMEARGNRIVSIDDGGRNNRDGIRRQGVYQIDEV